MHTGFAAALASHGEWHAEFHLADAEGRWRWLRRDGRWPLDEQRGRRLCVAADSSARQEAERMRRQSLQRAEENCRVPEASRLKSLFLATMSRGLRAPLNAAVGFTALLFNGAEPADTPRHAEYLGHLGSSAA